MRAALQWCAVELARPSLEGAGGSTPSAICSLTPSAAPVPCTVGSAGGHLVTLCHVAGPLSLSFSCLHASSLLRLERQVLRFTSADLGVFALSAGKEGGVGDGTRQNTERYQGKAGALFRCPASIQSAVWKKTELVCWARGGGVETTKTELCIVILNELSTVQYVAIATDFWASCAINDYMSLTVHFFRNSHDTFEQRQKDIEVIPLEEVSHTADNIHHFFSELLLQWDLITKVVVVWDGGADVTKALNDSAFVPVPCSAHLLMCVLQVLKILKQCQNQLAFPQHRMIQDVSTRWNSTLHMMTRLNEHKNTIIMASSRKDVTISAELMVDEWKKIEHLIDIIEVFDTVTLQLSKETSSVSEHYLEIPSPKGTSLQGLRNDLLAWLKQEFSFIHTNELIAKATVLDPRFKLRPFQQEKHSVFLSSIKDSTVSEMEKISVTHELSPVEKNSVTHPQPCHPRFTQSSHGIWARYKQLIPSLNVTPHSHTTAQDELNHYLNEPTINPESNPKAVGQYWDDSEHRRLKNVARKYLCMPSSTVSSERAFSTGERLADAPALLGATRELRKIQCDGLEDIYTAPAQWPAVFDGGHLARVRERSDVWTTTGDCGTMAGEVFVA
ncbi:hypothetical protein PR048_028301 [Dryococelus australis]|uniref:HAT C-terminal dimerisation domain-containing protein n=1 Tax=Dryococelus australis TaxID=614101 RepID=A0ABQ9GIX0_9NEOP|nr:hypothetical protein PR048_028301 [Dryococelus australis]